MIDCEEAVAHLQDYLKQELTAELSVEIAAHLERCRDCFTHARFEQSFLAMLARKSTSRCPDSLRRRVLDVLRLERRS